jgi:hypothetical protein
MTIYPTIHGVESDLGVSQMVIDLGCLLVCSRLPVFVKNGYELLQKVAECLHPVHLADTLLPRLLEVISEENIATTANQGADQAMEEEEAGCKTKKSKKVQKAMAAKMACLSTFTANFMKDPTTSESKKREFVNNVLPLVLSSTSQRNRKARRHSVQIINSLVEKGVDPSTLVALLIRSLTTQGLNSFSKSLALSLIAFLVPRFPESFPSSVVSRLVTICSLLLGENNKEAYKACLLCLRRLAKQMSNEELSQMLRTILDRLLLVEEEIKASAKMPVRNFIDKLIRRFGVSKIEEMVPEEHRPLVRYLAKQGKLHKKKKLIEAKGRLIQKAAGESNKKQPSEERSLSFVGINTRKLPQARSGEADVEDADKGESKNLLLKYDNASQRFHFVEHPAFQLKRAQKEEEVLRKATPSGGEKMRPLKDRDVFFDEETKQLVVNSRKGASGSTGVKRRKEMDDELGLEIEDSTGPQATSSSGQKQSYAASLYDRIHGPKQKKKQGVHSVVESGSSYKSSHASGDVVLPDRPAPHAFIQFNPMVSL